MGATDKKTGKVTANKILLHVWCLRWRLRFVFVVCVVVCGSCLWLTFAFAVGVCVRFVFVGCVFAAHVCVCKYVWVYLCACVRVHV